MSYRVVLQRLARQDISDAYRYAARRAPQAAERWLDRFEMALGTLDRNPQRCPLARENGNVEIEVREFHFGKRPNVFRVIFTVDGPLVRILRIRRAQRRVLTRRQIEQACSEEDEPILATKGDGYRDFTITAFQGYKGMKREAVCSREGTPSVEAAVFRQVAKPKSKRGACGPKRRSTSVPVRTETAAACRLWTILWALQRFYEKREDRFWEVVRPQAKLVYDTDDTRTAIHGVYYTPSNPLTLAARAKK